MQCFITQNGEIRIKPGPGAAADFFSLLPCSFSMITVVLFAAVRGSLAFSVIVLCVQISRMNCMSYELHEKKVEVNNNISARRLSLSLQLVLVAHQFSIYY